mmetsp:Transcript_23655/g.74025  ORF Transcript_23655/g.74025 Transcript_23655/m.74025 type:complete len:448 (-) Transcript_23655:344-1687(-)
MGVPQCRTGLVVALLSAWWRAASGFVAPQPTQLVVGRRSEVARRMVPVDSLASATSAVQQQLLLLASAELGPGDLPSEVVVPPEVTEAATAVATEAAKKGWFDNVVWLVEQGIEGLHGVLGDGSYGVSIIVFTLIVKTLTFPLNYAQIESTTKMQALQPAVKRIQAKYQNDPQQMNLMMAQLYEENNLNPLAGCLPALVQIPVFIALYRALLSLAKEDLLEESFLWLPSLEGPVFGAQNADWLLNLNQWVDGAPPLGWHDTLAYLSLPAILVVAQSISTSLLQPQQDPANEQMQTTNSVVKILPLMIGFFSLNVPSGLCIYWIVNNIFTTASTVLIKRSVVAQNGPVTMGGSAIADKPAKSRKSKKAATFDEDAPLPPRSISKPTTLQQTVVDVEPVPEPAAAETPTEQPLPHSDDEEPEKQSLSKSAAKRLQKASKSRRSKKSRRR